MNRPVFVVALGALALSGCSKRIKTAEVETFLTGRLTELGIPPTKVACPGTIEPKVGATFECNVVVEGSVYVVVGTITSVEADQVKFDNAWKNGEAVLRSKLVPALSAELSRQFETDVKVACAAPLLFLGKARDVACDLTSGSTRSTLTVTFDGTLSPTDWKLVPALLARAKLEALVTGPVRAKTSPGVTIACGDAPLITRPDDGVVWCQVAEGDQRARLKVNVTSDLQVTTWEVVAN